MLRSLRDEELSPALHLIDDGAVLGGDLVRRQPVFNALLVVRFNGLVQGVCVVCRVFVQKSSVVRIKPDVCGVCIMNFPSAVNKFMFGSPGTAVLILLIFGASSGSRYSGFPRFRASLL